MLPVLETHSYTSLIAHKQIYIYFEALTIDWHFQHFLFLKSQLRLKDKYILNQYCAIFVKIIYLTPGAELVGSFNNYSEVNSVLRFYDAE